MTQALLCSVALAFAASSAFAQIDASALRSKYGAPVDREIFNVRPGIEMIVDYGLNKQVCKIQLPSGIQIVGTVPPGAITKQQVEMVLAEVAPPSIRGKEIGRAMAATPGTSVAFTEYEHVTISESSKNEISGNQITVAFKDAACPKYNPLNPGSPR